MSNKLVDAISGLADSRVVCRSMVGRVREILPIIDKAQGAGVRLVDIAKVMEQNGFEGIGVKCLQNLLYQARKGGSRNAPKKSLQVCTSELPRKSTNQSAPLGIDAGEIIEAARTSMQSANAAHSFTIDLLRSCQSKERK